MNDVVALLASLIPSAAVVISAVITSRGQRSTHAAVQDVQDKVTTQNGLSLGEIADLQQDRAAAAEAAEEANGG